MVFDGGLRGPKNKTVYSVSARLKAITAGAQMNVHSIGYLRRYVPPTSRALLCARCVRVCVCVCGDFFGGANRTLTALLASRACTVCGVELALDVEVAKRVRSAIVERRAKSEKSVAFPCERTMLAF